MKFFTFVLLLQSLYLSHGQDSSNEAKRSLISYESKIFHKIPEHTIEEQKTTNLRKTSVPLGEKSAKVKEEKPSLPSYEFGYGVKDPVSGDHKDQWEKRHGDRVKGAYRFDESDGTQRVVEYQADGKRGFEATVKNVERAEKTPVEAEESGALKKEDKVAHSYSYLKRADN